MQRRQVRLVHAHEPALRDRGRPTGGVDEARPATQHPAPQVELDPVGQDPDPGEIDPVAVVDREPQIQRGSLSQSLTGDRLGLGLTDVVSSVGS